MRSIKIRIQSAEDLRVILRLSSFSCVLFGVVSLLVMVVDDSRTQRMVATSQLETVGVETITAENGAVAIDLLNAADRLPDIILMDVEMPVKDGIQALREIRKSVRFGHVPVIMITSRTGLKHRAMAQQFGAGARLVIARPFQPGVADIKC